MVEKFFGELMDSGWCGFMVWMVVKLDVVVVFVFFDGMILCLFQVVSYLYYMFCMGFFICEFKKCVDRLVQVVIGELIVCEELDKWCKDIKVFMDFLWQEIYVLFLKFVDVDVYGFEFEEKYKV